MQPRGKQRALSETGIMGRRDGEAVLQLNVLLFYLFQLGFPHCSSTLAVFTYNMYLDRLVCFCWGFAIVKVHELKLKLPEILFMTEEFPEVQV